MYNTVIAMRLHAILQVRGEIIGAVLVLLCLALPTLEARLAEVTGSSGRRAASESIAGAVSAFVFNKTLPKPVAKELAWATFTCLRNTNTCSMLIVHDGSVAAARGALGSACAPAGPQSKPEFASVNAVVQNDLSNSSDVVRTLPPAGLHLRTRADIVGSAIGTWQCIPEGCRAALVLPLPCADGSDGGCMIALSEFEDGFSSKDLAWLRNIGSKLDGVFER